MSIGDRIRATREERGISQSRLARLLDLNPIEISRVERGERKAYPPDLIIKISEILNVHIDWLFTGKGKKEILSPEQLNEFLSQQEAELDDKTKVELILQHEQTLAELRMLETQLKNVLQIINFDA
ncbi:MAG: helix-turn-helix domain-containing protein [Bacteroidota bacterium]